MRRYTVQSLWKNVTSSWSCEASSNTSLPEANTIDDGITTQSGGHSSNDFGRNTVPTQQSSCPDNQVSERDKAGATLLFSGIFLCLMGMTLTVMGWISSDVSDGGRDGGDSEWTQLLGPILLSVGGTFMLISICKLRMLSCKACGMQSMEGGPEIDLPPLSGPSFIFSSVNQPITFHRATVVHYIRSPYASVRQDQGLAQRNTLQASQFPLGVAMSPPPQYYSIYPIDNSAFLNVGEMQEPAAEPRENRSRNQYTEMEEQKAETDSVCPPAYADLYPFEPCNSPSSLNYL
ncbi:transmembrane protein 174 [Electrophorus electricus]|uniref:Transmembrane protein 174 n=1 Tax=Electrophorus electricus TaxID=8005 RepID=A0A4W4G430_ELEEL|nr:transmembrane protein 174 [Electrophorus electricus]